MSTRLVDLFDRAHAKSDKNRATGDTATVFELRDVVVKAQRGAFAIASRLNPGYFGKLEDLPFDTGQSGWLLPSDHDATSLLEAVTVAEEVETVRKVVEVPLEDRYSVDAHRPAVFEWGRFLRSRGTAVDPTSSATLRCYYSSRPRDPAEFSSETDERPVLDSRFPANFDEIPVLVLAIYLAGKDTTVGRMAEIQKLDAELLHWLRLYIAHVETNRITRRFPPPDLTQTRLLELASLLTA